MGSRHAMNIGGEGWDVNRMGMGSGMRWEGTWYWMVC